MRRILVSLLVSIGLMLPFGSMPVARAAVCNKPVATVFGQIFFQGSIGCSAKGTISLDAILKRSTSSSGPWDRPPTGNYRVHSGCSNCSALATPAILGDYNCRFWYRVTAKATFNGTSQGQGYALKAPTC